MTIQDLLRHTSGLTYGDTTPNARVKRAYGKIGVDCKDMTPAEQVERLGKVLLAFQLAEPSARDGLHHSAQDIGR
jgi:CubicO group peptidase (beta-lactamase class C family)